ncbi:CTP synthase [Candidatus Gracilibacteria bacterium]|nr:CTP synthase [Candidatus Gracilibacteria bacterium]
MKNRTKYIFITGGVCSSLGKGIAAASIGAILKGAGFKIFMQKLDPYLNIDPGTMSPIQHGEVFVTDDGAETDLDLGHYERFIDENLTKHSTVTTGKIYSEVLENERNGKFGGHTVQIVPHITGAIKQKVLNAGNSSGADFVIVEIGGTVGDIEGEPFLEAIRQLRSDLGQENTLFVHLTLLPFLTASKELKTKPTQLSVRDLRRVGIAPDIILARADKKIEKSILKKISMFCGVDEDAVIPAETLNSIYKVPVELQKYGISEIIYRKMNVDFKKSDLSEWEKLIEKIDEKKEKIAIGIAVKYQGLEDAYLSVVESLKTACLYEGFDLDLKWIDTEKLENGDEKEFEKMHFVKGICVPGGFGNRGIEGKILVAKYCRENKIPYLGLCLGSQILAIEFARNIVGLKNANSAEFNQKTENKIFKILDGKNEEEIGGTLRLGACECLLKKGSLAEKIYGTTKISERHRHRFEFNNECKKILEEKGLLISGISPYGDLMEIVENSNHPFMIGSQFHPEFKTRAYKSHPLFVGFVRSLV